MILAALFTSEITLAQREKSLFFSHVFVSQLLSQSLIVKKDIYFSLEINVLWLLEEESFIVTSCSPSLNAEIPSTELRNELSRINE